MANAISRIENRIKELQEFDPNTVRSESDPRVSALATGIDHTLASIFGADTVDYMRYFPATRIDLALHSIYAETGIAELRAGLQSGIGRSMSMLGELRKQFQEELDLNSAKRSSVAPDRSPLADERVFIVHGHDEGPREAVARFLERLGLKPKILHERASKGRPLITKLLEETEGVGFAIILLTPDDYGGEAGKDSIKPRARQNVVFELGFFIAALGPDRVAPLVKGEIELPSDYDGVVYIQFDSADGWRQKLGKELEAAGFEIDWNKVMR